MALELNYETPHGATAKYHKIVKIEYVSSTESVEVVVAVYATEEARRADKQPMWHEYIAFAAKDLPVDLRDIFYVAVANANGSYLNGAMRV